MVRNQLFTGHEMVSMLSLSKTFADTCVHKHKQCRNVKKGYKRVISIPASSCPAFSDWLRLKLFRPVDRILHAVCLPTWNYAFFEQSIWSIYQFHTWSSLTEKYVNNDLMSEKNSHLDWQFDSLAVFQWILLVLRCFSAFVSHQSPSRWCSWQDKFFDESLNLI